ncbi:MAG: terminase [Salinibacterium sp.]|nr:MAG: terminase [Salinibacterium sp.]
MSIAPDKAIAEIAPYAAAMLVLRKKKAAERAIVTAPKFRGAALAMQTLKHHEIVLWGPADTGKSYGCMQRLDHEARTHPNGQYGIVRKTQADFKTTIMKRWDTIIQRGSGVRPIGGTNPYCYVYDNGAKVWIAGLDRPSRFLSGEPDGVYVCQAEELEEEDWETLQSRTTGRGAVTEWPMIWGDANPTHPLHWLLSRGRPATEQSPAGPLMLLESRHEDNPELFDDDGKPTAKYEQRMAPLQALTGVRKERYFFGRWVKAEGIVYEGFIRKVHIIKRHEVPECRRYIASIDFGFTNAFVWQLWAVDNDGRMYLIHEIYRTGVTVHDHAQVMKEIMRQLPGGAGLEATVVDHDAEDRKTLEDSGFVSRKAIKDISPGIQRIQERLRIQADGRPRIFFVDDALHERDEELDRKRKPISTVQEFESYSWSKDPYGRSKKEAPVDFNNHGMDAMRYAAMYLDVDASPSYKSFRVFGVDYSTPDSFAYDNESPYDDGYANPSYEEACM